MLAMGLGCALLTPSDAAANDAFGVVDLHVDLSYQVNYKARALAPASGQFVADRLLGAGVRGVVLPLYVPNEVSPDGPRLSDLEQSYATMLGQLHVTPPYALPFAEQAEGHIATWFAFEGAAPFAGHPEAVKVWVDHGVRIWGLVHVHDNALATSAGAGRQRLKHNVGLTPLGHELVRAIHAAGGIIDVSHASDRAVEDILAHAQADSMPVIATHSNAAQLAPHARNLTDAQLVAIAATGGLIGVNFHGKFLARDREATLADVVEQIRYIADRVGVAHVGLGSDFEGGIHPPRQLRDVSGYPILARALLKSGFSRKDVRAIFAENALRLLMRPRD